VGGKGGGRPDMAQAGGTDSKSLPKALASVQDWVAERL
jgi:alanyl-tRNA synthetase